MRQAGERQHGVKRRGHLGRENSATVVLLSSCSAAARAVRNNCSPRGREALGGMASIKHGCEQGCVWPCGGRKGCVGHHEIGFIVRV